MWYVPYDEFNISAYEVNPPAEKHPRYSGLTYYQRDIIRNQPVIDSIDVKQQYANIASNFSQTPSFQIQGTYYSQQQMALELMFKKQKGEDSFYLGGYVVEFSQYFSLPPDLSPGGYIEDPHYVVPPPYWTDVNGNSIFSQTATYNPNVYIQAGKNVSFPYGLSWLRQKDTIQLQRTWFKKTMTWVGATLGQWDNEWYNGTAFQPYQTSSMLGTLNYSAP